MMRPYITRAELVAAVESGIEADSLLTASEKMMLRHVAQTATCVARAAPKIQGCGCPLTQAGLPWWAFTAFFIKFDEYTGNLSRRHSSAISAFTVVE